MNRIFATLVMSSLVLCAAGQKRADFRLEPSPSVSPAEMVDSIVAKYSGQIVILDFWATWCAPCLESIKNMESIKPTLARQAVQLLYITDQSSPESEWRGRASAIGGLHYYLPDKFLGQMLNARGITSIPTVMIFDKQGRMAYQGYPHNDRIIKEVAKIE